MDPLTLQFQEVRPEWPEVASVIAAHLKLMRASSPACAVHALDADQYDASGSTLYGLYEGAEVVAIGALREYSPGAFEIKSMHVPAPHRGRGLARGMLAHLLSVARTAEAEVVSLETGSQEVFAPARALYRGTGFVECPPFGSYEESPYSTYLALVL